MNNAHDQPDLVVVDRQHPRDAAEVAQVLRDAGLHPVYDDKPRYAVLYTSFERTPVYVPADEAAEAQRVLAEWYAQSEQRVAGIQSTIARDLLILGAPALVVGGVVGAITHDVGAALFSAFVVFLLTIKIKSMFGSSDDEA